jgi:hypothetical protein
MKAINNTKILGSMYFYFLLHTSIMSSLLDNYIRVGAIVVV